MGRCGKPLYTLEVYNEKIVFSKLLVSLLQAREHPGEAFSYLDHQEQESLI